MRPPSIPPMPLLRPPCLPYPMYHTRPRPSVRSKRISPPTATHSTGLTLLVPVSFVRGTRSKHRVYCHLYMLNTNGLFSWGCCLLFFFPSPQLNVTRASLAADSAPPLCFSTIRTLAQARRLCNIVLILVVLFCACRCSVCVYGGYDSRNFAFVPTCPTLLSIFIVYICFWAYGVIWSN